MIGKLKNVVLDAPDIAGLSAFYQALAGWAETYADDEWVTLTTPDGWRIALQRAPDHVRPRWPDPAYPQQAHLDLGVPDIEAAAARAVELGATRLATHDTWITLADPAGHPFDLCRGPEEATTTVIGVTLDCPDPAALARFYAGLLGKPVTQEGEGFAMIGEEGAQPVMFQQVAEYTAPAWPDPARPQQVHLDIAVDDPDRAEKEALALGARNLDYQGVDWRVYADPAGHPFCLLWPVA